MEYKNNILSYDLLRNDQRETIQQLISRQRTFLLARMGSGKTVCCLTAFKELKEKYGYRFLVVSVPRIVDMVWMQECDKWEHLNSLSIDILKSSTRSKIAYSTADIVLTTFGMLPFLSNNRSIYSQFDVLCIDESSFLKHWMTKKMKSMRRIINNHNFEKKILMTGTPSASGKYFELFSQTYVLDRGDRFGRSKARFEKQYYNFDRNNIYITYPRRGAVNEIRDKISDLVVVPDTKKIKGPIFNSVIVKLSSAVLKQYKTAEKDFFVELKNSKFSIVAKNSAVKWGICREIASGFLYDNDETHHIHNKKYEALEEIIDTTDGGLLIFYGYRYEREQLNIKFKMPHLSVDNLKKWNKGKLKTMMCSYRNATHGLNLQDGGDTIVWFTQGPPEFFRQGNSRIHGRNGKENVVIHSILADETVDMEYNAAIHQAANFEKAFVDSIMRRLQK